MVNHPPRTDPGVHVGLTAGIPVPNDSVLFLPMMPQAGPYVRYADWLGSGGWGGSAALAITPGARAGLQADLYAEVPSRSAGWAHGVGVVAAANYAMPYVQIGRQDEGGSGWYLTQGYAWRGWVESSGLLAPSDEIRPRYWSTTLTGRRRRPGRAFELYASGAAGHFDRLDREAETSASTRLRRRLLTLSLGVAVEANLRDLFGPYPPGVGPPRPRPPTPPPVPRP
jgi:hypothetical protein